MSLVTETEVSSGELFVRRMTADDPQVSVVIAHGAAEHSVYWRRVATELATSERACVLIPDLPGHGRSTGERLLITDESQLVGAIDFAVEQHRAERPGLPIVLLGHSMGGLAATRYAQLHGDKLAALVLHAAGLTTATGWDATPKAMTLNEMTLDPVLQRIILEDELRSDAPIPGESRATFGLAAERALSASPLGPLPLLWLQGQEDPLIPERGARAAFNRLGADRGIYLSYPGIGHGGILGSTATSMLADLKAALRLLLRT